jgi:hypothetical protein
MFFWDECKYFWVVDAVEEDVAELVRERVKELMNSLPLAGVGELLHRAKELPRSTTRSHQRMETERRWNSLRGPRSLLA